MLIVQQLFTGERSLFGARDTEIEYSTFSDGESPLKESHNIKLYNCLFRWKYPLWYSSDIEMSECTLFDNARAGIWYTDNISIKNTTIEAPKTFRRSSGISLEHVTIPNAAETLWNCRNIKMNNVVVRGDYFAMNSQEISASAKIISKDCFWNCENVTVRDSFISGEYVGWNAKNVTFENCTIESLQGLCYMDGVVLKGCRLVNTNLAFEYSVVDAEIKGSIDSVFNPSAGYITADRIDELTMNPDRIDPERTEIQSEIVRTVDDPF